MDKNIEQKIKDVVKQIVEDSSRSTIVDNEKTYERVLSPNIGDIVLFFDGRKFVNVKIINGKFWGSYNRVSNFWYWYEEDENGNYTKERSGYGCFYVEKE